jgi:broad specificity phosphatase PhoE
MQIIQSAKPTLLCRFCYARINKQMVDLLDTSESIKTVYLVRHGETTATQKGRICGNSDVPLTDDGLYQAEILGSWFSELKIDSIFASPLNRTIQTADTIARAVKMPTYFKHSGLTEKKEGDWEGKTYWQVRDENPRLWERWSQDPIYFAPPNGESVSEYIARVSRALNDIFKNYQCGNKIILVTHSGFIRAAIMNALNIPVENFFRIDIPTASVSRIDWSENFATLKYSGLILESYSYAAA